jgi:hypothetical protein
MGVHRVTSESDIVERLRQCDENFELVQEAADEIECLRGHNLDDRRKTVAAERAAILELVESYVRSWDQDDVTSWHEAAKRIAAAIKARGTE